MKNCLPQDLSSPSVFNHLLIVHCFHSDHEAFFLSILQFSKKCFLIQSEVTLIQQIYLLIQQKDSSIFQKCLVIFIFIFCAMLTNDIIVAVYGRQNVLSV